MVTINFLKPGRVVRDEASVDIYYQNPIPVYNITDLDNLSSATPSSGSILVSTYPLGIDLYNRDLGVAGEFDLSNSGISPFSQVFDIVLKRSGITISGARIIGRQ
jgi:hypothetical protein